MDSSGSQPRGAFYHINKSPGQFDHFEISVSENSL